MRPSAALLPRTLTMDEVARHDGRGGSYWIVIEGEVHDVSELVAWHPGGRMLALGAGRQATALFESYHHGHGLARAHRALSRRARHVGSLDPAEREPYGDPAFFHAVRDRVDALLTERGLGYHSRAWIGMVEAVVVVAVFLVAWYFRAFEGSWVAAVIGGLAIGRLGFVMHSGNHAAMGRRGPSNAIAGLLMDLLGGSSFVWSVDHQVAHHGHPNGYGHDNDCEIGAPALRFHPELPHRPWHRIQVLVVALGMSIGLLKWLVSDFVHLTQGRVGRARFYAPRGAWLTMVAFKGLWIAMHVVVPVLVVGPLAGLGATFVMMAVGGYYSEGIFLVNHIQRGLKPPPGAHWAVQQVRGTSNWRSGSHLANVISGGLNHQIEHHLFPSMSIFLYPVIAPVVRRTCEEHGLPYHDHAHYLGALFGAVSTLHGLGTAHDSTRAPRRV